MKYKLYQKEQIRFLKYKNVTFTTYVFGV